MNFFEQQDLARSNTTRLVILLCLAIICLIAATTALFAFVMYFLQTGNSNLHVQPQDLGFWQSLGTLISWETTGGIALIVICIVLMGSLFKYSQLSQGGRTVAESLGGKLINTSHQDSDEKKILNIVEEIAIASGIPVPPVYLLEDSAINAFAAGNNPQDAVIGVTRGCIQQLNRDQLQGVVAHEFSHIFHGDMRLNMRLVALLHGILILGLIGHFLMRHASYQRMSRSSKNNSGAIFLGAGIGLMVIGYAGTFFGNLIKAAVSRQREFLADASAVQYTRNPEGIGGALKKIGGYPVGSKLHATQSAEFSHMYFSQGISSSFNALMATHPPLGDRIRRIEPNWDGEYLLASGKQQTHNFSSEQAQGFTGNSESAHRATSVTEHQVQDAINHIGQPNTQHTLAAQLKLQTLPASLYRDSHNSLSACGIIFGLLLDKKSTLYKQQWTSLQQYYNHQDLTTLKTTVMDASKTLPSSRLMLIELCLPALKELSPSQAKIFLLAVDQLIQVGQGINLMKWSLRSIIKHHIKPAQIRRNTQNLRQQRNACQILLSFLAHADDATNHEAIQRAFHQAISSLRLGNLTLLPRNKLDFNDLESALNSLKRTKPLQKPQLLKAMLLCIEDDDKVTLAEAELFRAIAGGLDCPIPPFTAPNT